MKAIIMTVVFSALFASTNLLAQVSKCDVATAAAIEARKRRINSFDEESERIKKARESIDLINYIAAGKLGPGGMGAEYARQQRANAQADEIREGRRQDLVEGLDSLMLTCR